MARRILQRLLGFLRHTTRSARRVTVRQTWAWDAARVPAGKVNPCRLGFLLGATSGRTTLGGEGLQHQDGSSHLVAATIPNCKAYDPAFAGEMAVISDHGMRAVLVEQKDVFCYATLMNENYAQPDLPAGVEADKMLFCYKFGSY